MAGSQNVEICDDNRRELWSALAMIRECVELHAPPGTVKNSEYIEPPPMLEAEALVAGIQAIIDHYEGKIAEMENTNLKVTFGGKTVDANATVEGRQPVPAEAGMLSDVISQAVGAPVSVEVKPAPEDKRWEEWQESAGNVVALAEAYGVPRALLDAALDGGPGYTPPTPSPGKTKVHIGYDHESLNVTITSEGVEILPRHRNLFEDCDYVETLTKAFEALGCEVTSELEY